VPKDFSIGSAIFAGTPNMDGSLKEKSKLKTTVLQTFKVLLSVTKISTEISMTSVSLYVVQVYKLQRNLKTVATFDDLGGQETWGYLSYRSSDNMTLNVCKCNMSTTSKSTSASKHRIFI